MMGAHRSEGRSRDWLQQEPTEQQVQSVVSDSDYSVIFVLLLLFLDVVFLQ